MKQIYLAIVNHTKRNRQNRTVLVGVSANTEGAQELCDAYVKSMAEQDHPDPKWCKIKVANIDQGYGTEFPSTDDFAGVSLSQKVWAPKIEPKWETI